MVRYMVPPTWSRSRRKKTPASSGWVPGAVRESRRARGVTYSDASICARPPMNSENVLSSLSKKRWWPDQAGFMALGSSGGGATGTG